MKTNIVLIRYRSFWHDIPPMVDILYQSGRVVSLGEEELPKTAREFLKAARAKYEYDHVFGHCFVYSLEV